MESAVDDACMNYISHQYDTIRLGAVPSESAFCNCCAGSKAIKIYGTTFGRCGIAFKCRARDVNVNNRSIGIGYIQGATTNSCALVVDEL